MKHAILALAVLALATSGCGGNDGPPAGLDIAQITVSTNRIVETCQLPADAYGRAVFVEEDVIRRDVDQLVAVYERTDPDARFQMEGGGEPTTMRTVLRVVHGLLSAGNPCSASLDEPVARALDGG